MQDGGTPWFIAPQQGHLEVVCLLSDARTDKVIAMQGGATPLFIASQKGHLEVVCTYMGRQGHRNARWRHSLVDATSKGVASP